MSRQRKWYFDLFDPARRVLAASEVGIQELVDGIRSGASLFQPLPGRSVPEAAGPGGLPASL